MPALTPFKLERYFARYEFQTRHLLSSSDCETLAMSDLVQRADPESRSLWETLRLGYTESQGHPVLRAEVARLYPGVTPEQVLVLNPEEGIYLALQSLLQPGDQVIAVVPAYQSLTEVVRSLGCDVIPWTLTPALEGWRLDLEQLARSFTARTRLLVVNFPNNPTGFVPSRADWEALLDLARQHGVAVFSDEMYRGLTVPGLAPLPSACELYPDSVCLSGMSKVYGLPGLRIGWLVTRRPDWLARWQVLRDYTTICNSAPSEILALMALRAAESLVGETQALVNANRARAEAWFGRYPTRFRWLSPQGGSIAFPQWLGPEPVDVFCERAVTELGVMVVPASLFDYPGSHLRVGLGRRSFGEALEQLQPLVERRLEP